MSDYPQAGEPLTPKEWAVLKMRARGRPAKIDAAELSMGETTLKAHMGRIYVKLQAGSLIEALARIGWLTVPDDTTEAQARRRSVWKAMQLRRDLIGLIERGEHLVEQLSQGWSRAAA